MLEPHGAIDRRAARRNQRRYLAIIGAMMIIAMAGGGLLALTTNHHRRWHRHTDAVGVIAVVIIAAVMIAGLFLVAMTLFARPAYERVWQYPLRRRRRVIRALRKGAAISPDDRPVADAVMYLTRNARWNGLLFAFLCLIMVINALDHRGFSRWIWIAFALFYAGFTPVVVRQQRSLRRNYDRIVRADPPPEAADRSEPHA